MKTIGVLRPSGFIGIFLSWPVDESLLLNLLGNLPAREKLYEVGIF